MLWSVTRIRYVLNIRQGKLVPYHAYLIVFLGANRFSQALHGYGITVVVEVNFHCVRLRVS